MTSTEKIPKQKGYTVLSVTLCENAAEVKYALPEISLPSILMTSRTLCTFPLQLGIVV